MRYFLSRDGGEYQLEVEYRVLHNGHAGTYMEPPEGPEFEITSIEDENGIEFKVSDMEYETIYDAIFEDVAE